MEKGSEIKKERMIFIFCFIASLLIASFAFGGMKFISASAIREFYKSIISVSGVFLAFSPAFYVFVYSNPKIVHIIKEIKIKKNIDYRFKCITYSSFGLLIFSLASILVSYSVAPINDRFYDLLNKISFTVVIFLMILSIFYLILYGKIMISAIRNLVD